MILKTAEWDFLGISPEDLLDEARTARECAYSPYSGFPVGAALLADDGRIFKGCNVENGSYGLTVCAERSAVSLMIVSGGRNPGAIAIACGSGVPCPPCGSCRQVLAEFNPAMIIVLEYGEGSFSLYSLEDLLPLSFKLRNRDR
ncbi:MAG: cytidine deaminase [Thermovirgaceae bacterium]|nr:cytidine deaminase [Thermovirgaceae bacterium]